MSRVQISPKNQNETQVKQNNKESESINLRLFKKLCFRRYHSHREKKMGRPAFIKARVMKGYLHEKQQWYIEKMDIGSDTWLQIWTIAKILYSTFQLALSHHCDSYRTSNNQYPANKTIPSSNNIAQSSHNVWCLESGRVTCKNLFPRFEPVTFKSHGSKLTIAPRFALI